MLVASGRMRCAAAILFAAWLTGIATPVCAQNSGLPELTPYGVDGVPSTHFFRGQWQFYGTDPTPRSHTTGLGLPVIYGFDPVPDGSVHRVEDAKRRALPKQAQQVLTGRPEQ